MAKEFITKSQHLLTGLLIPFPASLEELSQDLPPLLHWTKRTNVNTTLSLTFIVKYNEDRKSWSVKKSR